MKRPPKLSPEIEKAISILQTQGIKIGVVQVGNENGYALLLPDGGKYEEFECSEAGLDWLRTNEKLTRDGIRELAAKNNGTLRRP